MHHAKENVIRILNLIKSKRTFEVQVLSHDDQEIVYDLEREGYLYAYMIGPDFERMVVCMSIEPDGEALLARLEGKSDVELSDVQVAAVFDAPPDGI